MAHDIKLNFNTDLKFETYVHTAPSVTTKVVWSSKHRKFIDIEQKTSPGYVEVSTDTDEHIATLDGDFIREGLAFAIEITTSADGVSGALWDVWTFNCTRAEDDVDLEDLSTAEIPDCIVDMLA